jgi:hypothetical protein
MHGCRYFRFLMFSAASSTLCGSLSLYVFASMYVTLAYNIQYHTCSHKLRIRTSPLSSIIACGYHVPSLAAQHKLIFGSLAEGVNAFYVVSQSSSRIVLWWIITRPPFAHENAWHAENAAPHPSQVG